jgi:hypothetical protein
MLGFPDILPPRLYRVRPQSIQSARLSVQSFEYGPPTPSPARQCCPLLFHGSKGETHACRGGREPNCEGGTVTLVLCVYYNPVTDVAQLNSGQAYSYVLD